MQFKPDCYNMKLIVLLQRKKFSMIVFFKRKENNNFNIQLLQRMLDFFISMNVRKLILRKRSSAQQSLKLKLITVMKTILSYARLSKF
jgi:hypothetical protein